MIPPTLRTVLVGLVLAFAVTSRAAEIPGLRASHPRLLTNADDWKQLAQRRAAEPDLAAYHDALIAAARKELTSTPSTYHKTGKRLLAVSRTVLERIALLSYAWRTTGDNAFARRAETEMLTVAAFNDWNPSHFLDVAEMTAALSLGYDWLFDTLSPASRATIRQAILEKGLRPGLKEVATGKGWPKTENNWNQVCFGGLTLGALAIGDEEPKEAAAILAAARKDIAHGLAAYAPDGVYPEGPGYWSYGTTYQVLMIAALESALGTNWDLPASPGFMASAGTYLQTTGPSGRHFNYSDGGEGATFEPAIFWFARKLNDPGLLQFERRHLASPALTTAAVRGTRFAPFAALWWPQPGTAAATPTLPLRWNGQGSNPIAIARGSWTDANSFYLALKGGAAELNHAHMDAGSFVYEANGVRWAIDPGMQDYESLESKGIDLWNKTQNSQRWTVFRLSNFSHNTLTLGNQLHRVDGRAAVHGFGGGNSANVDLTPVFAGQASRVQRSFQLQAGGGVLIADSLAGLKPKTEIRWQMVTRAKVSLDGKTATLQQEGRRLTVSLRAPANAVWQVRPADPPPHAYDVHNPGVQILSVTVPAPADGALDLQIELLPVAR